MWFISRADFGNSPSGGPSGIPSGVPSCGPSGRDGGPSGRDGGPSVGDGGPQLDGVGNRRRSRERRTEPAGGGGKLRRGAEGREQ